MIDKQVKLCVGLLRNMIASFWNANQSSQELSDNALLDADRLWCVWGPLSYRAHPFMNTVISTYSAFCCLLSPHLQMATKPCGRPFKSLWWKKSSSYCSYTICMRRTDYHPLKSYNLKALFIDRGFPSHFAERVALRI